MKKNDKGKLVECIKELSFHTFNKWNESVKVFRCKKIEAFWYKQVCKQLKYIQWKIYDWFVTYAMLDFYIKIIWRNSPYFFC